MVILREISEVSKIEYARSLEKITEIMIASTSHDMRTPLNTIINMHRLIESKVADLNLRKWLRVANNSTNLLMYLVNDTLDYFQIKSDKFVKKEGKFKVRDLVDSCLDLISIQMG